VQIHGHSFVQIGLNRGGRGDRGGRRKLGRRGGRRRKIFFLLILKQVLGIWFLQVLYVQVSRFQQVFFFSIGHGSTVFCLLQFDVVLLQFNWTRQLEEGRTTETKTQNLGKLKMKIVLINRAKNPL
jgi:hypothetical protein